MKSSAGIQYILYALWVSALGSKRVQFIAGKSPSSAHVHVSQPVATPHYFITRLPVVL